MAAATFDLTIEQGATFEQEFFLKFDTGQAVDLSGWTGRMQIRPTLESTTVLLELTTENGRIALGGVTGRIMLTANDSATSALDFDTAPGYTKGRGVYDLELEKPDGTVIRLAKGAVDLDPEVTR